MYEEKFICVECGKEFIRHSSLQVRCEECQQERIRIKNHERWLVRKEKAKRKKKTDGAVYENGHPQVCLYMKSCYYGSHAENGCSYLLETGKSRIVNGLFIEDGKCPAYKPKKKERPKRQEPRHLFYDKKPVEKVDRNFREV